jgi:uncharacterized protein (DUF849 family)
LRETISLGEASPVIVQACLNGDRPPGFHPRLPLTPAALAEDAAHCTAAGAAEFHVHPRRPDGRESLQPETIEPALRAIRTAAPGSLIGVSTGAWIEADPDRTLAAIAAWRVLPDHASVNLSEPAAPAVIVRVARRGIGVEAGLWSVADAERLLRLGLAGRVLRVLIEISVPDPVSAIAEADAVAEVLARAGVAKPILLHGADANAWRLIAHAAQRRFATRIGLEDAALLPDGTTAADNAALVCAALQMMRDPAVVSRAAAGPL